MKAWLLALTMGALFVGFVPAQAEIRQELRRLDLSEAQTSQVVQLIRETQPDVERYRAEHKVVQAKIAALLVTDAPARTDLEKLVRESQEWDFKIKMARIDRSLKVRAIVGKDKWAVLSELAARVIEMERSGKRLPPEREGEKGPLKELLGLLKDLN